MGAMEISWEIEIPTKCGHLITLPSLDQPKFMGIYQGCLDLVTSG